MRYCLSDFDWAEGIEWGSFGKSVRGAEQSREVFEQLAIPLFDSLYNFAHWLTQNREEAEDLVQEVYVKALKGFASFQPGTNFRSWIFRILRNAFLTSRTGLAASRTTAMDEGDLEELSLSQETPESLLLERASQEKVQAALEALPLAFREVLLLSEVEEMSYQEISETLMLPMGTVMSRLFRARRALRARLDERRTEAKHA